MSDKKDSCRYCAGTGYQTLLGPDKYKCDECDYWKLREPQEGSVHGSWRNCVGDPDDVKVNFNVDLEEIKRKNGLIYVPDFIGLVHRVDLNQVTNITLETTYLDHVVFGAKVSMVDGHYATITHKGGPILSFPMKANDMAQLGNIWQAWKNDQQQQP